MSAEALEARRRILDVASRLFAERGFHGIAMREIAEAAQLSKAALYYHFADKEQLFLAILHDDLAELVALVQQAQQHAPTTRAQIEYLAYGLVARAPEQQATLRLANQELAHVRPEVREEFNRTYHQQFIGAVERMLRQGMERGELRSLELHGTTWALLGLLYPLVSSGRRYPPGAVTTVLTIFFDGVALPPAQAAVQ